MNEHGIEELIGTLYEMVQDARSVPFSSDKCAVEREKVLDLLDEISNQLPGELKQAKTIVDSRSELITNAKRGREYHEVRAGTGPPARLAGGHLSRGQESGQRYGARRAG